VWKKKNHYGYRYDPNLTVSYDICTRPNIITDVKASASAIAQVPSFTSNKGLADYYLHLIFFKKNNRWEGDFHVFIEGKASLINSKVNKTERFIDQQSGKRRPRQNKTEQFSRVEPFLISNIYDKPLDLIDLNNLPENIHEEIELNDDQTKLFT
jgi:hypothetical protein